MEVCTRTNVHHVAHPSLRKLEGVLEKLEPLSDKHAIARFLTNVDDAKTLSGFVQELTNAITDYQVRVASPNVILDEHPARFPYNKEFTRAQKTSAMTPRTSAMTPSTSAMTLRTSLGMLRASLVTLRISLTTPRTSW